MGKRISLSYFHIGEIIHLVIRLFISFTEQIWKAVHLWRIYESCTFLEAVEKIARIPKLEERAI